MRDVERRASRSENRSRSVNYRLGVLEIFGGARRNRTDDLFNAIEALSQLSYGPILKAPHGMWSPELL
jgi:hypothetical protein